jgi:tetratricopeptide (TPR) repeat protein
MRHNPPPLLRDRAESFPGSVILNEAVGSEGVLLWEALRSAQLWIEARPTSRKRVFLPGAGSARIARLTAAAPEPVLAGPLTELAGVLGNSGGVTAADVSRACREISDWADGRGRLSTALAFMQTAALAEPENAEAAYLTGRLARLAAQNARAECWFWEAVERSHRSRDPASRALSFIGLGNLHRQVGKLTSAHRFHSRALFVARRSGLNQIAGMASHDLFVLTDEGDEDAGEAEMHAMNALHWYGMGHPRLPSLAHDLAVFWMNRGRFRKALPVLRAVQPHIRGVRENLLTLGSIARAAGAVGDQVTFDRVWDELRTELGQSESGLERTAVLPGSVLLAVAQGAESLGEWDRAERAADCALQVAAERGEAEVKIRAKAVRDAARNGRAGTAGARSRPRKLGPAEEGIVREVVEYLASVELAPA